MGGIWFSDEKLLIDCEERTGAVTVERELHNPDLTEEWWSNVDSSIWQGWDRDKLLHERLPANTGLPFLIMGLFWEYFDDSDPSRTVCVFGLDSDEGSSINLADLSVGENDCSEDRFSERKELFASVISMSLSIDSKI